jgi:hypothetical protein
MAFRFCNKHFTLAWLIMVDKGMAHWCWCSVQWVGILPNFYKMGALLGVISLAIILIELLLFLNFLSLFPYDPWSWFKDSHDIAACEVTVHTHNNIYHYKIALQRNHTVALHTMRDTCYLISTTTFNMTCGWKDDNKNWHTTLYLFPDFLLQWTEVYYEYCVALAP